MAKTKKNAIGAAQPSADVPIQERIVNGFVCENAEKWNRAVYGMVSSEGTLKGGVGEDATAEAKLAAYDKLGGLIKFDGRKVKTGAFFDFKNDAPIADPQPVWILRVDNEEVEVPVGKPLPVEAQAAEIVAARKADKAAARVKGKKAAPAVEDEE